MYREYIFRICFGILHNQKDAEDAAQEVFIKIYTSLPQYEQQGFKTWISRIAVNHSIDIKRKKSRMLEDTYDITIEQPDFQKTVEHFILQKEQRELIRKKIHELPENYRSVVKDFYLLEKSYEQIAKEHNLQIKTVEMKLYRARLWMKKHWKEEDFL